MSWGDEIDDELKQEKRVKVGFVWNFLSAGTLLRMIEEQTREVPDEYPKRELIKIWASALVVFFLLISVSYSVLLVATLPFVAMYLYLLIQTARVWKQFHYSVATYWLMTVLALAVVVAGGMGLRHIFFG